MKSSLKIPPHVKRVVTASLAIYILWLHHLVKRKCWSSEKLAIS